LYIPQTAGKDGDFDGAYKFNLYILLKVEKIFIKKVNIVLKIQKQ